MELVWYFILLFMLSMYIVMDGFDFGAGIIYLFTKKEKDKQLIIKAIGPFWDANEVWLVASGGVLFCAFPLLYASSFSGFYLPLIIILWLIIFRGIGLELRHQINHPAWHAIWDRSFGVASLLLALFFGTALGNVVRGVNMGGVVDGVSTHDTRFFFLPLWNSEFSPLTSDPGIIDWFTLLIGIIAVIALAIHGGNWIVLKTNAEMNEKLKKALFKLTFVLAALIVVSLIAWSYVRPNPFSNFIDRPWLFIFPVLCLIGLFGLFGVRRYKKEIIAFLFSTLFLVGGLSSTAAAIFPNLLPSTNDVNPSLTLYNTATEEYGLHVSSIWFSIAIVLVIGYFVIQYRLFKGKMDDIDYY